MTTTEKKASVWELHLQTILMFIVTGLLGFGALQIWNLSNASTATNGKIDTALAGIERLDSQIKEMSKRFDAYLPVAQAAVEFKALHDDQAELRRRIEKFEDRKR